MKVIVAFRLFQRSVVDDGRSCCCSVVTARWKIADDDIQFKKMHSSSFLF